MLKRLVIVLYLIAVGWFAFAALNGSGYLTERLVIGAIPLAGLLVIHFILTGFKRRPIL